ncbi:hypothetical protein MHK_006549 [Candidatus Magnetomorum sp. HK-1]|nr:hypothetical protein MHK_006549 [Candidatus Magnetomorum sp. HK-1]
MMRYEDKHIIADALNYYGLFHGLYYLELSYGLVLNKNLFLRYWYYNKEHVLSYFNVDNRYLFTINLSELKDLENMDELQRNPVSKSFCKIFNTYLDSFNCVSLDEFDTIKKNNDTWLINRADKNDEDDPLYFIRIIDREPKVYDAQKWEVCFTFTSFDKDYNLLSILPPNLIGAYDIRKKEYHNQFINFLEFLNVHIIEKMYQLWKDISQLAFISNMNYGFQDYSKIFTDQDYLSQYSDIVLGTPLRCGGWGVDKSFFKWALQLLVQRMLSHLDDGDFSITIQYNVPRHSMITDESALILNQSTLGYFAIGPTCEDTWSHIRIILLTSSVDVYLFFALFSKERKFLSEVLKFWLPAYVEPELVITNKKLDFKLGDENEKLGQILYTSQFDCTSIFNAKIGFKLNAENERLGQIGHTSFLYPEQKMSLRRNN